MSQLRYPVNALVSYFYFAKDDLQALRSGGLRLIGDSGAYSALTQGSKIDIKAFAEWGLKWRGALCWIASLDVIGDAGPRCTTMSGCGAWGWTLSPPCTMGPSQQTWDFYARDGVDFIGLGGLVGTNANAGSLMRWCLSLMRYAKKEHPQMRFHGWGLTAIDPILNLPWWSVDSSSYGSAWRYGHMRLFNPKTAKFVSIRTDGKEAYQHHDLITRYYGVSPAEIAVVDHDSIPLHGKVSARSYQYVEEAMARKFSLAPPTYGQYDPTDRQGAHVVDGAKRHLKSLAGRG